MPSPLASVTQLAGLSNQEEASGPRQADEVRQAAQQFEALLLAQLMATMRQTIPKGMMGQGYDAQMWNSMMDQALTDSMAQGGGIGLADLLVQQLDPSTEVSSATPAGLLQYQRAQQAYGAVPSASGPGRTATGALLRVQQAAAQMMQTASPERWSREGELTPEELRNDFNTLGADGVQGFNVLDAQGYRGSYKCNLFAFELAFRSGLRVPLMGRGRGWGYFAPHGIVQQIDQGRLDPRWARLANNLNEKGVAWAREQGLPLMLVGAGREGHAGHMGMVDEVHRIERDRQGNIRRIEYSGWEANADGPHYRRRTWGPGRYEAIHLLELREAAPGEPQCFPIGPPPGQGSLLDAPRFDQQLSQGLHEGEHQGDEEEAGTSDLDRSAQASVILR
jgi:Rod binding domain-containing protein